MEVNEAFIERFGKPKVTTEIKKAEEYKVPEIQYLNLNIPTTVNVSVEISLSPDKKMIAGLTRQLVDGESEDSAMQQIYKTVLETIAKIYIS